MDLLKAKVTIPITCFLNTEGSVTLHGIDTGDDRNTCFSTGQGPWLSMLTTQHPLSLAAQHESLESGFWVGPTENSGDVQVGNPGLLGLDSLFRPGMVDLEISHAECPTVHALRYTLLRLAVRSWGEQLVIGITTTAGFWCFKTLVQGNRTQFKLA